MAYLLFLHFRLSSFYKTEIWRSRRQKQADCGGNCWREQQTSGTERISQQMQTLFPDVVIKCRWSWWKRQNKRKKKDSGLLGVRWELWGGSDDLFIVYPWCWVRLLGPMQQSSASMSVFMSVCISSAHTHTHIAIYECTPRVWTQAVT